MAIGASISEERKPDGKIATLVGKIAAGVHSQEGQVGRGISDALQFGGRLPAFLQMYVDKHIYCGIREGPYAAFSEAMHEAGRQLLPAIVKQIRERGIRTVYALGPTPKLDAELLKTLAEQNVPVRYVAVDINPLTLSKAKQKVSAQIGTHTGSQVTLDTILGSFEGVNSGEKSVVIMIGGTVPNNPDSLWKVAAEIAKAGGLVVADSGIIPEHTAEKSSYWEQYWMSMYDTPAQRTMLLNGLKELCPGLFTAETRPRWQMRMKYVPHTAQENWKERFTTPRLQVELHVNKEIDVRWAGRDYQLLPSQVIVPVVSCKPDAVSFLAKAAHYGLGPVAAKESPIKYSIEGGPKAGAISVLFEVK